MNILELMPEFDEHMSQQMMVNSIMLSDKMREFTKMPGDFNLAVRSLKSISHFRLRFKLPVLLHFHDSTKYMRRTCFSKTKNGSFPTGFIPVYNCNLNHMTVFRTYRKTDDWREKLGDSSDAEYVSRMYKNIRADSMEQSSMNFLLQNKSEEKHVDAKIGEMLNMCFTYHYWRPPIENFKYNYSTIHNIIYNNNSKIINVSRIYKTIVRFDDLARKKYWHGNREFVQSDCRILCQADRKIRFKKANVLVDQSEAGRLSPGDMASCVMEIPIRKGGRNDQLRIHSIIGGIMKNDDLRNQISIFAWKLLSRINRDSNLCDISTIENLMNQVKSIINLTVFDGIRSDNFETDFKRSLDELYPLYFNHSGKLYHTPAPLISYVLCKNMSILDQTEKDELIHVLDFFDLMTPDAMSNDKAQLRRSDPASKIQSGKYKRMWHELITDLPRVANRSTYARLFSQASYPEIN